MSQESHDNTTTTDNPVRLASLIERTGMPVFVSLPPQHRPTPVDPAPGTEDALFAARSAGSQVAESRVADVVSGLGDSSAERARDAAIVLGELGDLAAVSSLIEVVEDRDGYFHSVVRAAACSSLGQLGDRSATPALLDAINDPMAEVSVEAIGALALLGDERATEPLTAVIRNGDGFFLPVVCLAAETALRRFEPPLTATTFEAVAADTNDDRVLRAAEVSPKNSAEITHDAIAEAAYCLWEKNGRLEGKAMENWLRAEAELRAAYRVCQQPS